MGKKVLRKERVYDYPPEVVWVALTDPHALAEWLMPNTFKAEVGHIFEFRTDLMWACGAHKTECEVLELEEHKRMVWSWVTTDKKGKAYPPMRMTWELAREGTNSTRLTFTQTGLEGQKWLWMKMMDLGWGHMHKRLIPKVLVNAKADGTFTPGAIPLKKRGYKEKTVPAEFIR